MAGKFVWLLWNGVVGCEKWAADVPHEYVKRKDTDPGRVLLAEYLLDADQENWPLAALAKQFPAPEGWWRNPTRTKVAVEIDVPVARDQLAIAGVNFWS